MLYHPAKDHNHCIYRMIAILLAVDQSLTVEKIRLLDFYYLFPHLIKEIKPWPSDISQHRKVARNITDSFEMITDKRRVFFELENLQKAALSVLMSRGILDNAEYKKGELRLIKNKIPKEILEIMSRDKYINSDEFAVITRGLARTKWRGANGLKKRTGLMEYKYDE